MLVPSPNTPLSLFPQAHNVPLDLIANECHFAIIFLHSVFMGLAQILCNQQFYKLILGCSQSHIAISGTNFRFSAM